MAENKEIRINTGFQGERYVHIPLPMLDLIQDQTLSRGLYLHSMGYFAHARYHYVNVPKGSKEYIFIFCREGMGKIEINKKEYHLTGNEVIVIPPNVPYRYEADHTNPWSIYWAHFGGANAGELSTGLFTPQQISISDYSRIDDRLMLFEEIFNTIKNGYSIKNLNFANICFTHFLASFSHGEEFNSARRQSEYSNNIIPRVVHFMNENIENQLTIDELSTYCAYSPSYFYRRFVSEMGLPPMTYFMRMKMNKASILLITTSMQVNQIASKIGFTDSFHFSRVFRRHIGMSPQQFRKQGFRL
jgi:AraC family transcriptional regulator of arabinose operon